MEGGGEARKNGRSDFRLFLAYKETFHTFFFLEGFSFGNREEVFSIPDPKFFSKNLRIAIRIRKQEVLMKDTAILQFAVYAGNLKKARKKINFKIVTCHSSNKNFYSILQRRSYVDFGRESGVSELG